MLDNVNLLSAIAIPAAVVGGLGLFFALLLSIAGKLFRTEENPMFDLVRAELPGANCGSCGFGTCDKYAEAVAFGEAAPNLCVVGGKSVAAKLSELTGVSAGETADPGRAIICCSGGKNSVRKYEYEGLKDCAAAAALSGGPLECPFGCIGLGSCERTCPQHAIRVVDGVARVSPEECIGCGLCISACPKGIIRMIPREANVLISCANNIPGAQTRKECSIGCIGCHMCEKVCPTGAVTVQNNLASIDYSKCISCGKCASKCPRSLIVVTDSRYIVNEAQ